MERLIQSFEATLQESRGEWSPSVLGYISDRLKSTPRQALMVLTLFGVEPIEDENTSTKIRLGNGEQTTIDRFHPTWKEVERKVAIAIEEWIKGNTWQAYRKWIKDPPKYWEVGENGFSWEKNQDTAVTVFGDDVLVELDGWVSFEQLYTHLDLGD